MLTPIQTAKGKHAWLLKDESVARWLKNVGRGSIITAEVSLRRLGKACELLDITPKEMVAKASKVTPNTF